MTRNKFSIRDILYQNYLRKLILMMNMQTTQCENKQVDIARIVINPIQSTYEIEIYAEISQETYISIFLRMAWRAQSFRHYKITLKNFA